MKAFFRALPNARVEVVLGDFGHCRVKDYAEKGTNSRKEYYSTIPCNKHFVSNDDDKRHFVSNDDDRLHFVSNDDVDSCIFHSVSNILVYLYTKYITVGQKVYRYTDLYTIPPGLAKQIRNDLGDAMYNLLDLHNYGDVPLN